MRNVKIFFVMVLFCIIIGFLATLVVPLCTKQYRNSKKLIDAIESNDVEQVKLLLDEGIDPNQTDIPVSRYWSFFEFSAHRPLSTACREGNLEIVSLLIEYGATAEYIEYTGWSPLRSALLGLEPDDVEIVELLLEHGADPNMVEADHNAIIEAAGMYPFVVGNGSTDYDLAAAKDITQIVFLLLGENNLNMQSSFGYTLLMRATIRGNTYLAEALIQRGCDVNITNNQGKTAYDLAVEYNRQDIAELIRTQSIKGQGDGSLVSRIPRKNSNAISNGFTPNRKVNL